MIFNGSKSRHILEIIYLVIFQVGVEESKVDEHYIGNFTFHPRELGAEQLELRHAVPASFVVVAVESNHGHPQFTCLYRIRVHGKRFWAET